MPNCHRTSIPKFHVEMLLFNLAHGLRNFFTPKWANKISFKRFWSQRNLPILWNLTHKIYLIGRNEFIFENNICTSGGRKNDGVCDIYQQYHYKTHLILARKLTWTKIPWMRKFHSFLSPKQGWEFAHRFSETIARFSPKNERMSDSLKKTSDSLIC